MRTQVGIIGAGPAGLTLAHLLQSHGVDSVVLEARNRAYIESRIRAGVLEQGTADLLNGLGLGARMQREGLVHHGIELGFQKQRRRIDMTGLTGHAVTVYAQHEVVKDLIAGADERGIPILCECSDVRIDEPSSPQPSIAFIHEGKPVNLRCEYIAGCDGFHGISRPSIPDRELRIYERVYPFSWLGILVEAPPSHEELVYMNSDRGFALFSMRSPSVTRLYLQCENDADLSEWPDERVWDELFLRFESEDGWLPNKGRIVQKSITPMRSFVTEPMQFGRLFLAGDAAHIVPPTGAKGLNLAIADVKVLAECLAAALAGNDRAALDRYSGVCLRRVWAAQRFSWWMTSLMHNHPESSDFDKLRVLSELDYITTSEAAAKTLAENYVGLPIGSAL